MNQTISSMFSFLLDVLMPPRRTERLMRMLTPGILSMLAGPDSSLPYHEPRVTALVWELKYRKNPEALKIAGGFLAEAALGLVEESGTMPVLVPVPMHEIRRKMRGYNQTEVLCEAMMRAAPDSFIYAPQALKRVRETLPQQSLPRHRRLKNMIGAIETQHIQEIEGRVCILVDDVSTTGATLHEAKRALLESGAREVHCLALSHS